MRSISRYAFASAVLALSACHGSVPAAVSPTAAASLGSASFLISVPPGGPQSIVISDVSTSKTQVANFSSTSSICAAAAGGALNCTATVSAPIGEHQFRLQTYSAPNGTGTLLSTTQASALITGPGKTTCAAAGAKAAAKTLGVRT